MRLINLYKFTAVWTILVAWTLRFQRSVYFSMSFGRSRIS